MIKITKSFFLFISTLLFLTGCITTPKPVTDRNSKLTQGNVQCL